MTFMTRTYVLRGCGSLCVYVGSASLLGGTRAPFNDRSVRSFSMFSYGRLLTLYVFFRHVCRSIIVNEPRQSTTMPGLYLDTGYLPERVTVIILGQGLGHPPELCQSYSPSSSESAYPMAEVVLSAAPSSRWWTHPETLHDPLRVRWCDVIYMSKASDSCRDLPLCLPRLLRPSSSHRRRASRNTNSSCSSGTTRTTRTTRTNGHGVRNGARSRSRAFTRSARYSARPYMYVLFICGVGEKASQR